MIIPTILSSTELAGRRRQSGQALIEVYFVFIFLFFLALLIYETSVTFHNFNVVNNALKQAAWKASMGAPNDEILEAIANADQQMAQSSFFMHYVDNFGLYVFAQTGESPSTFISSRQIAPNFSQSARFTGGTASRAAYLWRAQDYNIRVGVTYHIGMSSLFFGADPVFTVAVPLVESTPVLDANDEDRDGLVDLYEPELFVASQNWASWTPLSHTDTGVDGTSMNVSDDRDSDGISDTLEEGYRVYDFDNDGLQDKFDTDSNMLRHPVLGGRAIPSGSL